MSVCRGCGQQIRWIRMTGGRMMPVDPVPIYYEDKRDGAEVIVTEDGRISAGRTEAVAVVGSRVKGYRSHFASCPAAGQFRRRDRE